MSGALQAGAATSTITPWLGIVIPGSFRPRYANDINDELLAKALVLDNGEVRIAMVTCDLIAMPQKIADAAKARIAERCDIPPERVMVTGTHTHTGASVTGSLGVEEDTGYTAWAPLKIADAVELAVRRLRPARVGFATAHEDRISFCRRWHMKDGTVRMNPGMGNPDLVKPASPIDPELAIMYVEGADGAPISTVANFALHYVGTDDGNAISADYFGHFFRLMRRYLGEGCVPLLWNGAAGQITNNDYSGRSGWTDRGHARAQRMANVIAGHVIAEIQLMEMHEELELGGALGAFAFSRKRITPEDLEIAEKILAVPVGTYDDYDTGPFSWVVGQPIPVDRVDVYARQCRNLSVLPERMSAPVQALRIGEAAIAALPGEVFVEIGLNLKAESSATPLFVVSLANGHLGYISTDEALREQGGYETWASRSALGGPGTAPAMEAQALSLLEELMGK